MTDQGEDYVPVNVDLLRVTLRAIHVRCADNVPRWIAKSLIYGPDASGIDAKIGQLFQIKIFRWVADQLKIPQARK